MSKNSNQLTKNKMSFKVLLGLLFFTGITFSQSTYAEDTLTDSKYKFYTVTCKSGGVDLYLHAGPIGHPYEVRFVSLDLPYYAETGYGLLEQKFLNQNFFMASFSIASEKPNNRHIPAGVYTLLVRRSTGKGVIRRMNDNQLYENLDCKVEENLNPGK